MLENYRIEKVNGYLTRFIIKKRVLFFFWRTLKDDHDIPLMFHKRTHALQHIKLLDNY